MMKFEGGFEEKKKLFQAKQIRRNRTVADMYCEEIPCKVTYANTTNENGEDIAWLNVYVAGKYVGKINIDENLLSSFVEEEE